MTSDSDISRTDTSTNRPELRRRTLLWGICAVTFIVYLDTSIAPVAIPTIADSLGGGDTAAQWMLDAYTLAFACLLLSGGLLGDRFGTRRMLLGGTGAFGLASIVCALAPTMNVLITGRALQGVCAAVIVPLSVAALTTHFPDPTARAKAIGLWGGTAGVALALGPLVGGVLVSSAGWQSLFWINIPIALFAWGALRLSLHHKATSRSGGIDVVGQAFFVAAGVGATLALVEGPHRGWAHPFVLVALAVAALSVVLFVVWERRAESPMLPPGLLRIPEVFAACAVNFLGLFGLYGVLFILTLYLQGERGLSPIATGLEFLPLFGAMGVGSLTASYIVGRLGTRPTMLLGLGSICVGMVGLMSIPAGAPFAVYGVALALLGIGIPLSGGVVAIAAMMNAVPAESVGAASGAMNTFRQFGAVFGVAAAAIASPRVGSEVTSMSTTFMIGAVGALLGAVLTAVVLRPSGPRR
ncbi:MFS transporter [Rhodococcus sp. EPR-157]|uniref:MFS transporter n=1 Tax=Rhodococcus sp. EPR-157 TaxID=1813677 RepID=UPI001E609B60|nr:MFS transporter [Rhodococcus sp. EPR-157]